MPSPRRCPRGGPGNPGPNRDDPGNPKALNEWMDACKARFNEDADLCSVHRSLTVDVFAKAAGKAGQNLTVDALVKSLETNPYPRTFLGNPEIVWTATKRMGQDQARVAQIRNGRWANVSEFAK